MIVIIQELCHYLIIEQQVSFKAAITIKERFLKMINNLDNLEVLQIDLN